MSDTVKKKVVKKKKKKVAAKKESLIKKLFEKLLALLRVIKGSIFADDPQTRRISYYLIIGICCVILAFVLKKRASMQQKADRKIAIEEVVDKFDIKALTSSLKETHVEIGRFVIELNSAEKYAKKSQMAEFDLIIECSNKEICKHISKNKEEYRHEISIRLYPVGRDELIDVYGKKKLKTWLIEQLSELMKSKGFKDAIKNVYFSHLVLG